MSIKNSRSLQISSREMAPVARRSRRLSEERTTEAAARARTPREAKRRSELLASSLMLNQPRIFARFTNCGAMLHNRQRKSAAIDEHSPS